MIRLRRWRAGERVALLGLVLLLASLPTAWFGLATDGACRAFGGAAAGSPELQGRCASVLVAEQLDLPAGWGSLGILWALALGVMAVLTFVALLLTLRVGPTDPTAAVMTTLVLGASFVAVLLPAVLVRALWLQPGLDLRTPRGEGLPGEAVSLAWGGWVGVAGLALVAYGLWRALADERRDAPDSVSPPVPVRPAPGASA